MNRQFIQGTRVRQPFCTVTGPADRFECDGPLPVFRTALFFSLFTLLVLMSMRPSVAAPATPPVAKKIPTEIVTHGDKRVDDYFWLREKTNAGVLAYLQQEKE